VVPIQEFPPVEKVTHPLYKGVDFMSEFTLVFRGRQNFDSPERAQQNVQAWQTWFKELGSGGHIREPDHRASFESAGKVVRGNAKAVSDGSYAEAKDVVSGYARIEAQDFAQAVELSKRCPILDVGGSVEVRPIVRPKASAIVEWKRK
jgi:hypothetical protein